MNAPDPFKGMPAGMWEAEWVASSMEAAYPGVSDAGYLAAVKAAVIEILGDRSYPGRESGNLRVYLDHRGYTAACGFPDNPAGCDWPVETGSLADLNAIDSRRAAIEGMMDRAFEERDRLLALVQPKVTIDFSDLLAKAIAQRDTGRGMNE